MTAVEWLTEKLKTEFGFVFSNNILEQAKEMEKQKQDEFAIGFAEWFVIQESWNDDKLTTKQLLEIYKKEKGL